MKQAIKDLINPASILISLLILLNLISGITVIFVKNQYRNLFIQMQQIKSQEQKLNTQHSQLLLERSTWQSQGRVERSAEKRHNMKEIAPSDIKIVKIHKS